VIAAAPAEAQRLLAALAAALPVCACAPPASEIDAGPVDAPEILAVDPPDGSVGVEINPIIRFQTSEHLDDRTVDGASFELYSGPISMWLLAYYDPIRRRVSVWPSSELRVNADWVLEAGDGIRDLEGEPLAAGAITRFTTGEDEGEDVPFPELRYDPDIRPTFEARCASCHGGGSPLAGLALDSPQSVIGTAIGVASRGRPSFDRISPAHPGRSYLAYKLLGDGTAAGLRMPCSFDENAPAQALEQAELEAISDWIAGGAEMGP
jgi:hypothetical protein